MSQIEPAHAAAILAMAAMFDNRKESEEKARALAFFLNRAASKRDLDPMRTFGLEDCRDAICNHYDRTGEFLTPSHLLDEVLRIRSKRISEHPPLVPPPGLDDAEERHWLAGATRRIGDGQTYDSDAPYELVHDAPRVRALLAAATPPAPDDAA
ncbi:hypothetical protein F9L07_22745 [Pimelobacter simplex]|uniref:Uncharacterized protein n=1 Tax=Nocardioides simplex TaxID=2045 RepID=A0A7J5DT85_NOCSI|nr:hypothetical protein [Pimelobacter simplex]KAB2808337.1 hypothetical protein F9L07_22745 [Pimelobacter simplex]